MQSLPTFKFEKELWQKGIKIIGGADEVGRGAFAGPVVAACVVFNINQEINILIHDSKILTQKQREKANLWIKEKALAYGIGSASVTEINKHGIVKATNIAFRRAIRNVNSSIEYLLIDAFYVPRVHGVSRNKQLAIIKGDSLSVS